jgi:alpha-L-fucosidase
MGYYSAAQEDGSFIDRVSKGGNLLLNISPMPDGTIPQQQLAILNALGSFLKQMGTAIYDTRPWTVYGEGPTKLGGGSFTQPTALTSADIRYTRSKDGDAVYAIVGGWPGNGKQVNLTAVTTSAFALGSGKVFLFAPIGGSAIELQHTQDGAGLHVTLPGTQPYNALAYAMKISKSGTEPAPTPTIDGTPEVDGGAPPDAGGVGGAGTGGTAASGGSSGESAGASAGSTGVPGTGAASGTTAVGGSAGARTTGGSSGSDSGVAGSPSATTRSSGDSSGCACTLAHANESVPHYTNLWLATVLAMLFGARRKHFNDMRDH